MTISDVSKISWQKRENSGLINGWYNVQACLEAEEENSLELNTQSYFDQVQNAGLPKETTDPSLLINQDFLEKTVNKVAENVKKAEETIKKVRNLKKLQLSDLELIKETLTLLWYNLNSDLGSDLNPIIDSKLKEAGYKENDIRNIKDFYFQIKKPLGFHKELLKEGVKPKNPVKRLEINLDPDNKKFLELVNQHIYLDNYTADLYSQIEFYLTKLITDNFEIAARDLVWYSFEDLAKLITDERKLTKDEIENREKYRVIVKINGQIGFFYSQADFEQIQSLLGSSDTKKTGNQVTGLVACPGFATGTVKVVLGVHDIEKVNTGDIIVSNMTRPDLILAIKKAAAIVTDLGGITSHAAIISRELNIPCIVGTKLATQFFKDGDLIEVDADKGIAKRLI